MRKTIALLVSFIVFISFSCSLFESDLPDPWSEHPYLKGKGAFVINEGNFRAGNGSISYYSLDSLKIYNDLFKSVNGRPLGDIPNSMVISNHKIYIIVNNSGKIEVADIHNMESTGSINNLDSPRNMLIINKAKAYVTSLYSKEIAIIDLNTNSISGKINIHRSSEAIILAGQKVYVSCWTSVNKIMVINPDTDQLIDSITVGQEPESMVLDKENRLWVLCSGGYSGQYYPELIALNTSTDQIVKRLTFNSKYLFPSTLSINSTGDTLYYLGGAVWRMAVTDSSLPSEPFVNPKGRMFYKIGVQPGSGHVFATNAVDYQQRGYLLRFNTDGIVIDSVRADIIPGTIYFKPDSE